MPSQFSNKREELCRHVKYYKGCLSCSAHETRIDLAEATTQSTHRDETIKGLTALLQKPDLNRQEKNRLTEKQSKTEAQRAAWRERCDVVTEMLAFLEAGIKTICDLTEPDELAQTFESNADERQIEYESVWESARLDNNDENKPAFELCPEDPDCQMQFRGFDYANVVATPDTLLGNGVGLQAYLRAGKALPQKRLPIHAVGEHDGPAIMNYGRALVMFAAHGCDQESGGETEQQDEVSSLEDNMKHCALAMDERTRRQQLGEPQPTALLTEDEQWELFSSAAFMLDIALLARQYAKLVAEKTARAAAEDESTKDTQSAEGSKAASGSSAASTTETSTPGGWPPVDHLNWIGFTNWVYLLKKANTKLKTTTMKPWKAARAESLTARLAKLANWEPPQDFDDGSSNYPNPRTFYDGPSLGQLDAERLKLARKEKGKGKKN